MAGVRFAPGAADALSSAWAASAAARPPPLYDTAAAFTQLVCEVLSRDIRSAHQRERGADGGAAAQQLPAHDAALPARGTWRVILDGVNVGYELDAAGCVVVTDVEKHRNRDGGTGQECGEALADEAEADADACEGGTQ